MIFIVMNVCKDIVRIATLDGRVKETIGGYLVPCPVCGKDRLLKTRENVRRSYRYNRRCNGCSQRIMKVGKKLGENHKLAMSVAQKKRYSDLGERKRASNIATIAMHRPDVRKKHIEALHESKWLKVKTDKGQLEMIEKWNRIGFNFEPNYQVHTDVDLFYIDGYDPIHTVVLEYDSKYHMKLSQRKKDLIRQNKIIDLLNPKVFWRYNVVTNKFDDVHRSKQNVS